MDLVLDILQHRGKVQIAIIFPYNFEFKQYIKQFNGVKWSATKGVFYTFYSKENFDNLVKFIGNKYAKLDSKRVRAYIEMVSKSKNYKKLHAKVIDAFLKWMEQKRYSENTIHVYESMLITFFTFYSYREMDTITQKDISRFNHAYFIKNKYSYSSQNQFISAIKLFYKKYNQFEIDLELIERPQKSSTLPQVLSIKEVESILNASRNLKHKMILSIIYSAGLRIGEALNLKLTDLDSDRMLIRVENAKGRKDRYVQLSERLIFFLREYYKIYRPKIYLFEGKYGGKYTQSSSRNILKQALQRTDIKKRVTLHTLRHSYATHLLESGTDIRYIQELLGHQSPKTTMIYTHVTRQNIENIKSPFDNLEI